MNPAPYMLDTDICIAMIRGKGARVIAMLKSLPPGDALLSSVTAAELYCGVFKCAAPRRAMDALAIFMGPFEVASFGQEAALAYGRIRAALEKEGKVIGSMDMLIGAHALSWGATLVTHNTREFSRVKGLKLADWLL
ncbi:MAG: type II toxin-antitoxin system VapC family toxin [Nitrospinae bacterium]|nr:type II toxin-antitoxin system VapC family toxin [Nitrospinota bacterium]